MRIIALIILIFGVALAGGAVFFASERYAAIEAALAERMKEAPAAPAAPEIKTTAVVVANDNLKYGAVLERDAVKLVEFPVEIAPSNGFGSLEELFGANGDEKRFVLRTIEPNEPILKTKVSGFGERATISAQLTPGMRAFTLQIDTVTGVAGLLLPNDRVDVFLTRTGSNGLSTNVIMQNVKVIAVDQFSDQESTRARVARTATVEVSPEDAQKLSLAQQLGRISLSLRQIDETETSEETSSMEIDDLIEKEATPTPVERAQLCVRKGVDLICE